MYVNRYKYIDENRAHLHTLDGKPLIGASTATKIIGKGDGLLIWAVGCAVETFVSQIPLLMAAALRGMAEFTRVLKEVAEEAKSAWKNKRDKSAEKGTERHGLLEDWVEMCIRLHEGKPMESSYPDEIEKFVKWAVENVDHFLFTEKHGYHEPLWVGGIADIGMVMKDGRRLLGDHKSSKEAYLSHWCQVALYDLLLSYSGGLDRDGNKLFDWEPADGYVIFPFRSSPFTPEFRYNVDELRAGAAAAVRLYKLDQ